YDCYRYCVDPRCLLLYRVLWMCASRRCFFFLMRRRPPRSTLDRSSAASDVYKRQQMGVGGIGTPVLGIGTAVGLVVADDVVAGLSLIHISEPTRLLSISYAVFCLKKKKQPTVSWYSVSCGTHGDDEKVRAGRESVQ